MHPANSPDSHFMGALVWAAYIVGNSEHRHPSAWGLSEMTAEETQLTEAQRILDGSECPGCCDYDRITINHEPGVIWIECARCLRSVCAPDFEIQNCLKLWNQNQ